MGELESFKWLDKKKKFKLYYNTYMEFDLTKIIISSRFKIGVEQIQTHHLEVCLNFKP
jgi:hypothetical protein